MSDESSVADQAASTFERLFARGNRLASGVFAGITCFASFESVPGWGWFGWDVEYSFWLALAGLTGLVAGFLSAERRLAGAIALGICGVGGVAATSTLLWWLPRIPFFLFVLAIAIGFLPGIAFYWIVEQLLGRRYASEKECNGRDLGSTGVSGPEP